MTGEEWIEELARALGVEPPTPDQFDSILRLASIAAHASERKAAPVACWVAANSARPLEEAEQAAEPAPDEKEDTP